MLRIWGFVANGERCLARPLCLVLVAELFEAVHAGIDDIQAGGVAEADGEVAAEGQAGDGAYLLLAQQLLAEVDALDAMIDEFTQSETKADHKFDEDDRINKHKNNMLNIVIIFIWTKGYGIGGGSVKSISRSWYWSNTQPNNCTHLVEPTTYSRCYSQHNSWTPT